MYIYHRLYKNIGMIATLDPFIPCAMNGRYCREIGVCRLIQIISVLKFMHFYIVCIVTLLQIRTNSFTLITLNFIENCYGKLRQISCKFHLRNWISITPSMNEMIYHQVIYLAGSMVSSVQMCCKVWSLLEHFFCKYRFVTPLTKERFWYESVPVWCHIMNVPLIIRTTVPI